MLSFFLSIYISFFQFTCIFFTFSHFFNVFAVLFFQPSPSFPRPISCRHVCVCVRLSPLILCVCVCVCVRERVVEQGVSCCCKHLVVIRVVRCWELNQMCKRSEEHTSELQSHL